MVSRYRYPLCVVFGSGGRRQLQQRLDRVEIAGGHVGLDVAGDLFGQFRAAYAFGGVEVEDLAQRAAEFAEARTHYEALVLRRRNNGVLAAQQEREAADAAYTDMRTRRTALDVDATRLDKDIADRENRSGRDEQIRRRLKLRRDHGQMPPAWRDATANQLLMETWRDATNIDRRLAEKRVYPAINVNRSGTRREELLLPRDVLQKTWILRRLLHGMDDLEAVEFLLGRLRAAKTNGDFFGAMR